MPNGCRKLPYWKMFGSTRADRPKNVFPGCGGMGSYPIWNSETHNFSSIKATHTQTNIQFRFYHYLYQNFGILKRMQSSTNTQSHTKLNQTIGLSVFIMLMGWLHCFLDFRWKSSTRKNCQGINENSFQMKEKKTCSSTRRIDFFFFAWRKHFWRNFDLVFDSRHWMVACWSERDRSIVYEIVDSSCVVSTIRTHFTVILSTVLSDCIGIWWKIQPNTRILAHSISEHFQRHEYHLTQIECGFVLWLSRPKNVSVKFELILFLFHLFVYLLLIVWFFVGSQCNNEFLIHIVRCQVLPKCNNIQSFDKLINASNRNDPFDVANFNAQRNHTKCVLTTDWSAEQSTSGWIML